MDQLQAMRLFCRVIDRGSFSSAAADVGIPRSTASEAVRDLEARLGSRLIERTTRHLAATPDGEEYYQRCLAILGEIDDAEAALRDAQPHGVLRIDAHPNMTRTFLLPQVPQFLARFPRLELQIGQGDRLVDLVREGVDCVIRAGRLSDSTLIQRQVGLLPEATVASPAYLQLHGYPDSPAALAGHQMVGFVSSRTGEVMPLEFSVDGRLVEVRLPSRVRVNDSDTAAELARLGMGLLQAPRYRFTDDIATGRLVEVLSACPPSPTPVFALYPQRRHMPLRLRVFLDWLASAVHFPN